MALSDLPRKRPTLYPLIPSGNLLVNYRENNQLQAGTAALLSKQIIFSIKSLKSCYPEYFLSAPHTITLIQSRTISTSETDKKNLHFRFNAICFWHKQQLGQNHRHTTHPAQGAETLVNPLIPITGRHILVFGRKGPVTPVEVCRI